MVRVIIDNKEYSYEYGTPFKDIVKKFEPYNGGDVLLVNADGKLCELHKTLGHERNIELLTLKNVEGQQAYERSTIFILLKALHELYPEMSLSDVTVEFKIGHGLYIDLKKIDADEKIALTIKKKMQEIIDANHLIYKMNCPLDEALNTFRIFKMHDKEKLFKYRRASRVNLYDIDDFTDYFYGYMVYSTGYIKLFDLLPFKGGLMLMLPTQDAVDVIPKLNVPDNLFEELIRFNNWANFMQLGNVADLNDHIANNGFAKLVLMEEAHMEKRIGDVAQKIADRNTVKTILIAGPSSSGKTSFAYRLGIQLMAHGITPHQIESDNYFKERSETPVDENGNYDFECLEAMDIELLKSDLKRLSAGEEVELPKFNFRSGKREYNGNKLQLGNNDMVIIEGIHCLDDAMLEGMDMTTVFGIFINAITPLNIDDHNYIHATDARLLRRIVRDNRTRGYSVKETLAVWPSVRHGEERYIMPFIRNADAVFNSSMLYEFSLLKPYAEAMLFSVQKGDLGYPEAKRLLKMLDYFLTIPAESVPSSSIMREFIGGIAFDSQ